MTTRRLTPITAVLSCCMAILVIAGLLPSRAAAQETQRAAAVVDDDVVSLFDLEQRMKLVLMSSNLPDTVETRKRVLPQVLRRLVDERIEIHEAKRRKIEISAAEVDNGMATIARQNRMDKAAFEQMLEGKGVNIETIRQQVRAELSWVRVVRQELMPTLHIGEEEIDARLQTLKANLGKPEYLVAEIFLAVDDPRHDGEMHALADRLMEQMTKGAPFSALAQQFSQTGASGGDLGWVSGGMLDEKLMAALSQMQPGTATPPIRTLDGYHILLLRDKRIAGQGLSRGPSMDVLTVDLPALPSSTADERNTELKHLQDALAGGKSCDDYEKLAKDVPTAMTNRSTNVVLAEVPREVQALIGNLQPGQISSPLDVGNGRRLFAVCSRKDASGGLPSRDDIHRRIQEEQLDVMAKRYLRDLRRAAFVEIRV